MKGKEYIGRDLFDEDGNVVVREYSGELIRCKDCKHWDREDGTFKDFDGKEWHGCKELSAFLSASGDVPMTPAYFYCGNGEKNE